MPTPILKSVPSQFSPFPREITNAWHTLQNNSCPKSSQKGESKRKLQQLKHKAFSVILTSARQVWQRPERHKGQFQLVQSTVNELYHQVVLLWSDFEQRHVVPFKYLKLFEELWFWEIYHLKHTKWRLLSQVMTTKTRLWLEVSILENLDVISILQNTGI